MRSVMRIAICVDGTRGDVFPMLALGEKLRARGHEVVVAATPDFREDAETRGLAFQPVGRSARVLMAEQSEAVVKGGLRIFGAIRELFDVSLRGQFAVTPDAVAGADLVIGAGVQLAASSAAERHGIAYRYVAYCPMLFASGDYAPFIVPFLRMPRWANRFGWWSSKAIMNRLLRGALNHERAVLGLGPIADPMRMMTTDAPILAADPELAPVPRDVRERVTVIACLHPLDGPPLPDKLEAFLDAGPPPVYLGFGSMTDTDPAATTRVLLDAVERAGCRAIVSEGWAGLGREPLPGNVLAIGAVSHARLFPRCAAIVHHGGAGTTTTSARAGVPQIIIPHLMDQYYWADRVRALGLGPAAVTRAKLTGEALAPLLREATENELLAERAHEVGARLRTRIAELGDPSRHFEAF
jgi:UDP:flavonoid glycosyltransferase YjiC (YdhE family)